MNPPLQLACNSHATEMNTALCSSAQPNNEWICMMELTSTSFLQRRGPFPNPYPVVRGLCSGLPYSIPSDIPIAMGSHACGSRDAALVADIGCVTLGHRRYSLTWGVEPSMTHSGSSGKRHSCASNGCEEGWGHGKCKHARQINVPVSFANCCS